VKPRKHLILLSQTLCARRTKPEYRLTRAFWLCFYYTVPLAAFDALYCGVYLGHGINYLFSVIPHIAVFENEPIGYAQSYVALGSGGGWWEDESDPGVRGIDQFLANPEQLNRGLGAQLLRTLVEHLFAQPMVTKIQTDPTPRNLRAISCYKKAGFIPENEIMTPDGPALYMIQTRKVYEILGGRS
jgi:ribosomal protein S18 acetylase RimI-like enzyme